MLSVHVPLLGTCRWTLVLAPGETAAMPARLTCPPSCPRLRQQSFMEGGLMPRLEVLLQDGDATVRTKALLALRCGAHTF